MECRRSFREADVKIWQSPKGECEVVCWARLPFSLCLGCRRNLNSLGSKADKPKISAAIRDRTIQIPGRWGAASLATIALGETGLSLAQYRNLVFGSLIPDAGSHPDLLRFGEASKIGTLPNPDISTYGQPFIAIPCATIEMR
jgi:hypothetical protein